jgi:phage baseplate assembly protein V
MRKIGIVQEIDAAKGLVRVTFPDHDQLKSWWLGVLNRWTQNNKDYGMPDVGEQVVCLMDDRMEDGEVLGSRYSTVDAPPVSSADKWHVTMKDGAIFEYDRASHALTVAVPAGGTINITVGSTNMSLAVDSSGDATLNSDGNVTIVAAALIKLAGGGPLVARLGDQVTVPNIQSGSDTAIGTISTSSVKVQAG